MEQPENNLLFIADGGEMGEIIRAKDWSKTALGNPETWPQSLRTTLGIILNSKFPMFLFWGPELICFYNDAYRPILGKDGKHPNILGGRGDDNWKEAWHIIKPLIDRIIDGGEASWSQDQLIPIFRNGTMENGYWTFSYSPVKNEWGQPVGVFVTGIETTDIILTLKQIEESEERLRKVIEQASNPILVLKGEQLTLELANESLYKVWNVTKEALGKPFLEILPEMKGQPFEQLLLDVLRNGTTHYGNEQPAHFIRDNGEQETVYFNFVYQPYRESDKRISGIIVQAYDVTPQILQRKQIEESEKQFRFIASAMPQKVWTADANGNVDFYNKFYLDYFGFSMEELKDWGWKRMVHPDEWEEIRKRWQHSIDTGDDFEMEHRFIKKNGDYEWHLCRALAFKDENGKIRMWIGTNTVIDVQKKQKEELEKAVTERNHELEEANKNQEAKNKELERMNKELQSFSFISSHDLQEPLRKIQTFSSQILENELQNLSESGKDKFRRIQNSANRMQALIEDLLIYSHTNTTERIFEKVSLTEIAKAVLEDLIEEIQQKHAVVNIIGLCEVYIIPFQFHQLLYNLISNSLKYSSATPCITIKSVVDKGEAFHNENLSPSVVYCHISVSDNGIGFDAEYKEKIFELFQRLHGRSEYIGTGIGLAIVKKIVENHDGIITANGETNNGATFDIYIPADRK